ncbi:MAG TPA: hypothetical protein VKX46_03285 [Ktedonobacteraceae bacterium]|nr:hypothetical protein [Ktedonobacteraceae bacterium]
MNKSEVARFKLSQTLQEQAAHQGLYGPAAVARHDFIEARIERDSSHLIRLLEQGSLEQVENYILQMQDECRGQV